jgi:N-acetylglutamate synthase-like GNAT family acetyltransferase
MSTTFRRATVSDVPAVAAIIEAAYQHYIPVLGGRKPMPMQDDHAARIARGETWLIDAAGEAVGVTSMHRRDDAIHIFNIAIHPAAQGRGLLRAVFAFAEGQAREGGATKLALFTNALMERNRAIYAHLGFREIREEQAPGGYRIVFLERPLSPA